MKKQLTFKMIAFLGLSGLMVSYGSLADIAEVPEGVEPKLKTIQIQALSVPVKRVLEGKVEAVNQAMISAQTSGQIAEVYFDVNDVVEKGQVLLKMRDLSQQADHGKATAAEEEATARHAEAKAAMERTQKLMDKKLISKAAYDKAKAALKSASARLEAAKSQVKSSIENIEHTIVRAPYSGIVTTRHIQIGEVANVGTPLFSGIALDEMRVVTTIPQEVVTKVKAKQKAEILLSDGETIDANAVTIFPYADPRSSTFTARVGMPKAVKALFPGMFVKVAFTIDVEEVLLVPQSAVAYRSGVSSVYTVDAAGKVAQRLVRLGRRVDAKHIVVLSGLVSGDVVALEPLKATAELKAQRQDN